MVATSSATPSPPPQTTTGSFQLIKGIEVEVSSDDEGFRGAWYKAKVIEVPPKTNLKKRKKALIEYVYLLAEDGSTPLTEYVDPGYIRPLPPVDEGRVFDENDAVEAWWKEGWWTGIVKKVLEDDDDNKKKKKKKMYRVYFDNPHDIIEFSGEDLRIHLKWARGAWVQSHKHLASDSIFRSGTSVEVIIDKEKFKGIWFPAIVIKEFDNDTFLVKYSSISADDQIKEGRLTVDLQCIRPAPAQNVKRKFELLEKVDAIYNGGWRAGVVTKVLTGDRCNVFFKQGNEDRELSHSDIRPHVIWTGDNRDYKSKVVPIASDNQDYSQSSKDANNNVINKRLKSASNGTDKTKQQTPCTVKTRKKWTRKQTPSRENPTLLALSSTNKRIKLAASSSKKLTDENVTVQPLSSQNGVSRKTTREKTTNEALSRLATPKRQGAGSRTPSKSHIGNQSSAPTPNPLVRTKRIKQEKPGDQNQNVELVKSKRIQPKAEDNIADSSAAVKDGSADVPAADNNSKDAQKLDVVGTSVIIGLTAGKEKSPERMDDSTKDKNGQITLQKGSSQRRKRGRPRKWTLLSEAGNGSSGADGTVVTATVSPDPKIKAVGMATDEIPSDTVDDDQPLSTWIGVHTSTNLEESRKQISNGSTDSKDINLGPKKISIEAKDVNLDAMKSSVQTKDVNLDAKKSSVQSDDVNLDAKKSSVQSDDVNLAVMKNSGQGTSNSGKIPFVKKSPVWGTIESMEVFKIVPQEPHFSPLADIKEEYREGSAIGMMITFATLFDNISKLQIDNPKSIFDSTLESLLDLEKQGFDVAVLKDRLNVLLAAKVEEEELQIEFSEKDRLMLKHSCEKAKYEVEVREIKKKIAELEEQHQAAESKKDAEDKKVARRKLEIETIHERIQHAQSKFAYAATAPWKSP
ncbi:hypothetical protein ACFE04_017296 [Oxalis oulophora]